MLRSPRRPYADIRRSATSSPRCAATRALRDVLRRYLQMSWEELAFKATRSPTGAPFLVRLLRHSLLLDAGRGLPTRPGPLARLDAAVPALAERRDRAARHRRQPTAARVDQLPDYAQREARRAVPARPTGVGDRPAVRRRATGGSRGSPAWTPTCSKADRSPRRSRQCWTRRATASTRGSRPSGPAASADSSPAACRAAWGHTAGSTTSRLPPIRRRRPPQGCSTRRDRRRRSQPRCSATTRSTTTDARWQITARSDLGAAGSEARSRRPARRPPQ